MGELATAGKRAIFHNRNVEDIRGQLKFASNPEFHANFSLELQRRFHAAMLARGTGQVRMLGWAPAGETCELKPRLASGTLVSDSRLYSAHHLVEIARDPTSADAPCHVSVSFESRRVNRLTPRPGQTPTERPVDGRFQPYDNPSGTTDLPVAADWDYEWWAEKKQNKSEVDGEESPLLANRLVQLGLDDWAEATAASLAIRDNLRIDWPFRVELDPDCAATSCREPQTFDSDVDPAAIIDAVELAACDRTVYGAHDDSEPTEDLNQYGSPSFTFSASTTPSGGFPMAKPGVFFDQGRVYRHQTVSTEAPVWPSGYLLHVNEFPYAPAVEDWSETDESGSFVALVSNPGFLDLSATTDVFELQTPCTSEVYDDSDPLPVLARYGSLYRTTLDALQSSSGGLVTVHAYDTLTGNEGYLSGIGFAHSTALPTEAERWTPHYINGLMTVLYDDHAADPEIYKGDETDLVEDPDFSGVPTELSAASFTVENWGTRDVAYGFDNVANPYEVDAYFDPEPHQHQGGGGSSCAGPDLRDCPYYDGLDCEELDGSGNCLSYASAPIGNSLYPIPPGDACVVRFPHGHDPDDPRVTPQDVLAECDSEARYISVACDREDPFESSPLEDPYLMPNYAGLGVGFMGSATQPSLTADSAVADLQLVCAPWSEDTYTDNWRDLFAIGRMRQPSESGYQTWTSLVTDTGWLAFGSVALALSRLAEERCELGEDSPGRACNGAGRDTQPMLTFKEARGDEEGPGAGRYLRPVSMKLCPPNYYLEGFWVEARNAQTELGEDDDNLLVHRGIVVRGIVQLDCVLPPRNRSAGVMAAKYGYAVADHETRWTKADDQNHDPAQSSDYTLDGRRFDLDQHIGNPGFYFDDQDYIPSGGPNERLHYIGCEDERVLEDNGNAQIGADMAVGGLVVQVTGNGGLQGLWVRCVDLPK